MSSVIAFIAGLCIGAGFGIVVVAVLTSGGDDHDGF